MKENNLFQADRGVHAPKLEVVPEHFGFGFGSGYPKKTPYPKPGIEISGFFGFCFKIAPNVAQTDTQ